MQAFYCVKVGALCVRPIPILVWFSIYYYSSLISAGYEGVFHLYFAIDLVAGVPQIRRQSGFSSSNADYRLNLCWFTFSSYGFMQL
jgi:hypothetical protein